MFVDRLLPLKGQWINLGFLLCGFSQICDSSTLCLTQRLFLFIFSVPVVQKTVGQYAKHIVYYSETKDSSIPTEDIGVPNTERGRSEDLE